ALPSIDDCFSSLGFHLRVRAFMNPTTVQSIDPIIGSGKTPRYQIKSPALLSTLNGSRAHDCSLADYLTTLPASATPAASAKPPASAPYPAPLARAARSEHSAGTGTARRLSSPGTPSLLRR